jgi:glutathione peroxidase
MFSKVSVVGADQHPLYQTLTSTQPDATGDGPFRERLKGYGIEPNPAPDVLWNFEKFVIGRDGRVVGRFSPDVTADDPRLLEAIQTALSN